jgi:hypothetical protein
LTSFFAAFLRPSKHQQQQESAMKKGKKVPPAHGEERKMIRRAGEEKSSVVDVYLASASRPHPRATLFFFRAESVAMLTPHNRLMFHDFYYAGIEMEIDVATHFWREDRAEESGRSVAYD